MKTAYSYRRFSSSGQATGSSLERQLEIAKEVCVEQGWSLADLPPDKGLSGFTGANKHKGALGIFINKVKAGEIQNGSVLILEKMDRFSRNEVDLVLPDFLHLLQSGIELYSCTDSTLYTLASIRKNPMMLNYAIMGMAMANDFSKTLSNRVKKSFDLTYIKAKEGKVVNFGAWQPKWISLVDGKFVLNDKAEIIKRIYNEYMADKSMVAIAKGLIVDDIEPIGGGKTWVQSQIRYFLTAETLIGTITIKKQTYTKYYPVVLTDNQWNMLQAKLHQNRNRRGGRKPATYIASLLPNRVFCSKCGGTVNSHQSTNGKGGLNRYYKCTKARYNECDCRKMIGIKDIEESLALNFLSGNPDTLTNKPTDSTADDIQALNGQKLLITKQIDRLTSIEDIDLDILRSKLLSLKSQLSSIDEQINQLRLKETTNNHAPEMKKKVLELFKAGSEEAGKEFVLMLNHIRTTLLDHSKRQQLVHLLPSLVEKLEIRLDDREYLVTFTNGNKSDWIHV